MVLVTAQKVRDLIIERLQRDDHGVDFQSFPMIGEDTLTFTWRVFVREDDLLDINDIEFHIPEHYRHRE